MQGTVLVAVLLFLAALALHGGDRDHRFLGEEDPSSLHPFSIDALAAIGVLATPRADGDQPLARLAHRLTIERFGLDAGVHHAVGAALHACTAVLVLLVLLQLAPRGAAIFAAFAFALAEPSLETVQWISMRGRLLAGLFGALALFLRARDGAGARPLSAAAFLLALAAHPLAASLPGAFALVDRRAGRSLRGALLLCAPSLAALAWAWSGVRAPPAWLPAGIGLALFAALLLARHRVRTSDARLLWAGLAWFLLAGTVGALLPYAGAAAPRSLYLALPGLFLAVGASARILADGRERLRRLLPALAALLLVALALESAAQLPIWRDLLARSEALLARAPDSVEGHRLHGQALLARGKLTAAAASFERADELAGGDADSQVGLGVIDLRRPLLDRAQAHFERALALEPHHLRAHHQLGEVLQRRGDRSSLERAVTHLTSALDLAPSFSRAWTRLAVVLALLQRTDEARAAAERALAIDARDREAILALGMTAEQEGNRALARREYARALESEPDYAEALTNLGRLELGDGEVERSIATLERACFLHPLYAGTLFELANAYRAAGRDRDAILFLRRTLAQQSGHMRATVSLAELLLATGERAEARATARGALLVNPSHPGAHAVLAQLDLEAGDWAAAAKHLGSALAGDPERSDLSLLQILLLAAAPDGSTRDGARALALARRKLQLDGEGNPRLLAAYAAAQAETGDRAGALASIERALELAAPEDGELRRSLEHDRAVYAADRPLRLGEE